jgi:nicotinate phosphoribosyltransferase
MSLSNKNINSAPIITSLLDTDFYKLTMMQCVFHHFRSTKARYKFISRKTNIGEKIGPLRYLIQEQINQLCLLTFNQEQINYLKSLNLFQADFLDYLSAFRLNSDHLQIKATDQTFELIIEGPWVETILFEVPILAIISETYTQTLLTPELLFDAKLKLEHKIEYIQIQPQQSLKNFKFSDFGTRRRFSKNWQDFTVSLLHEKIPNFLYGTSNILLSKNLNMQPIGTMAHEYLQAFQVLAPDLGTHQRTALEIWLQEYKGLLAVALTDVINIDCFLKEFTPELAKRYRGLRHDSGDPIVWGNKVIDYYLQHHISPKNKLLVFSDSLTFTKMLEIYKAFNETIPVLFGIGTNLTNDFNLPSLDIVIKLTHINDQAVVKISDTPQKRVCEDPIMLDKLNATYHLNFK